MPKVKLICSACRNEVERAEKPKPKTLKEAKQVYFICPSCGSANLRDGTARPAIKKASGPVVSRKPRTAKAKTRQGNDNPGPEPIKEPKKKEVTNEEKPRKSGSWTIF